MSAICYEYGTGAVSSASVSSASSLALAANIKRRSAILCNNGGSDVFLAAGIPAVAGQGILLKANGGAYEINSTNLTRAPIYAITASGTSSLSVHEGT
jgi:hypothetical protein